MKVMEELKQYHYDLVLLDIMLPGMSGYDISHFWKENGTKLEK